MSLEGIIIGIIGVVLGAVFTFGGYRWFLLLLPIWGLFVGFSTGADAVSTLLNEGFLASIIGIGVGVVLGIVFALLSWFFWWGAVVVIAGWLGYAIAHWALVAIGFNATGILPFVISLAAGAVVAIGALAMNAPKLVAVVLTSVGGAAWLTAGIALIPGIIKPEQLNNGSIAAVYTQGWLWIVIWIGLSIVGIIEQMMTTARLETDLVEVYSTRSPM